MKKLALALMILSAQGASAIELNAFEVSTLSTADSTNQTSGKESMFDQVIRNARPDAAQFVVTPGAPLTAKLVEAVNVVRFQKAKEGLKISVDQAIDIILGN